MTSRPILPFRADLLVVAFIVPCIFAGVLLPDGYKLRPGEVRPTNSIPQEPKLLPGTLWVSWEENGRTWMVGALKEFAKASDPKTGFVQGYAVKVESGADGNRVFHNCCTTNIVIRTNYTGTIQIGTNRPVNLRDKQTLESFTQGGNLKEFIELMVRTGEVCQVRGHQWYEFNPGTGRMNAIAGAAFIPDPITRWCGMCFAKQRQVPVPPVPPVETRWEDVP